MGKNYSHFDHKERTLIYWWRKEHLSLRDMARRLRRSHTSISRELKRNRWCGKEYFPRGAQLLSDYRLQERAQRERLKTKPVQAYVQQKLHIGWTPELIAGRLKQQEELPTVCHESIYQYIYCVAPALIPCLPRHHFKGKTEVAVSENWRANQEPEGPRVPPKGGHHTARVWALGSRHDCGGEPPAWIECLG